MFLASHCRQTIGKPPETDGKLLHRLSPKRSHYLMASTRAGKPLFRDFGRFAEPGRTNQRSFTDEIHPGYILRFLLWATKTCFFKSSNNHGSIKNDPLLLTSKTIIFAASIFHHFPWLKIIQIPTMVLITGSIHLLFPHYKSSNPRMKEASMSSCAMKQANKHLETDGLRGVEYTLTTSKKWGYITLCIPPTQLP